MYGRIIVAIDMARLERADKAVRTAAELGKALDAEVWLLAVTGKAKPHDGSRDAEAFGRRLEEFASAQGNALGVTFRTRVIRTADAYSDLKKRLFEAIDELGADLLIVTSHVPGFTDHVLRSTSAAMARHAKCSVFVVR